ncbi:MAG: hypothetical protein DMG72_08425 [Acidobacteria bacterium]|nr:MAG: hypothetical protein DMG72_08425 [Acidobacteriota bacterium]
MAIPLSDEIRALLDAPNFAHLATLMPDGSPQSVPIWVGREGDRILICTGEGSLKAKNTRRDPRVSLSIAPSSPTAVTGPTPGTTAAITRLPPDSPAAAPTTAPTAFPMPGCSAASTGTDSNSFLTFSGINSVILLAGTPVDRKFPTARSASARKEKTPVTACIFTPTFPAKVPWGSVHILNFLMRVTILGIPDTTRNIPGPPHPRL